MTEEGELEQEIERLERKTNKPPVKKTDGELERQIEPLEKRTIKEGELERQIEPLEKKVTQPIRKQPERKVSTTYQPSFLQKYWKPIAGIAAAATLLVGGAIALWPGKKESYRSPTHVTGRTGFSDSGTHRNKEPSGVPEGFTGIVGSGTDGGVQEPKDIDHSVAGVGPPAGHGRKDPGAIPNDDIGSRTGGIDHGSLPSGSSEPPKPEYTPPKTSPLEREAQSLFRKYDSFIADKDYTDLISADKDLMDKVKDSRYSSNTRDKFENYQSRILNELREIAKEKKEEYRLRMSKLVEVDIRDFSKEERNNLQERIDALREEFRPIKETLFTDRYLQDN